MNRRNISCERRKDSLRAESKLEYLFRRLRERLGDNTLTEIVERLYDLIILEKEKPSAILRRLSYRLGRRSKVRKYLEVENLLEAQKLLEEDLVKGMISRRTYYRAGGFYNKMPHKNYLRWVLLAPMPIGLSLQELLKTLKELNNQHYTFRRRFEDLLRLIDEQPSSAVKDFLYI